MEAFEYPDREIEWQSAGPRWDQARSDGKKQRLDKLMSDIAFSSETTGIATGRTASRSRLDEILLRHRKRRIRAVALLVLWTVLCGALLAL